MSSRLTPLAAALGLLVLAACARSPRPGAAGPSGATASAPGAAAPAHDLDGPAAMGSLAPRLSSRASPRGGVLLSWLEPTAEGMSLDWSELPPSDVRWSAPHEVVSSATILPNAADIPGVVPLGGSRLLAHWRETREPEGAGYDVRAALSFDDGKTWERAITPHRDKTDTEHGFVVAFDAGVPGGEPTGMDAPDGRAHDLTGSGNGTQAVVPSEMSHDAALAWLDGRDAAEHPEAFSTQLMTTTLSPGAAAGLGSETLLDSRTCDCCPMASAQAGDVTLVAYRDRTDDDVRDIAVVRRLPTGSWTVPAPVHEDGWRVEGCPVNGPDVDAEGARAALAWFTAAADAPRVLLAFSDDAGQTWSEPARVDDPSVPAAGHAGIVLLPDGAALVSWVARTGAGTTLMARKVSRTGVASPPREIARGVMGVPQVARDRGSERIVFAWTQSTGAPEGSAASQQRRVASAAWAIGEFGG